MSSVQRQAPLPAESPFSHSPELYDTQNVLEAEKSPRDDPAWASFSSNHLRKATSIVNTLSLSQSSCLWTKLKNFLEKGMLRNDGCLVRLLGDSTDGKEAPSELGATWEPHFPHSGLCLLRSWTSSAALPPGLDVWQ